MATNKLLLVDSKSPIKTVQEFIARRERLLYGSPGVGNGLHLATEIFAKKAGISLQHVPYKGASDVMTALLSGSVQVMFATPPSVMGLIKDGRARPLAFPGTKPFPPTPDVPLMMKDLLPGYQPQGSWGMFFAPGETPDDIVKTQPGDTARRCKSRRWPASCNPTATFPTTGTWPRPLHSSAKRSCKPPKR